MPEMSKPSCLPEVSMKGGAKLTLFTLPEFAAPPFAMGITFVVVVCTCRIILTYKPHSAVSCKVSMTSASMTSVGILSFSSIFGFSTFVGLAALSRTIICTAPWVVVPWSPFWTSIWLLISIAFSRIWALFTAVFGFLLTLSFVFALVERLAFAALLSFSFFNSIHIHRTWSVLRCRNWGTQRHRLRPAYGAGVKSQSWLPEFLIGRWILEGDLQIGLQLAAQALHENGKTQFIS